MKISYIAHIRLPTEKGHGLQIMKMCEAFALEGHDVELIVAEKKDNPIKEDPLIFYGIREDARMRITIKQISSPNLIKWGKVGFWLQSLVFSELAALHVRKNYPDVVYSRDPAVLLNMFFIHKNLVWEAHRGEDGLVVRMLLKKARLVAITYGLVELYQKYLNTIDRILVAPDAVDLSEFEVKETREQCRQKLGLPQEKKIALYWGHLYGWKGVQTLADASQFFNNYELAIVAGGHEKDIEQFRETNRDKQHLVVMGRKPRETIAYFMRAADVLVLPNSGKEKISSHYTSPLKLFEYMASKTPIVSSDLPSLREILNEKNALFFTPDNPKSLYEAIKELFGSQERSEQLAEKSHEDVISHYTWDKRAQKIIDFMQP